MPLVRISRPSLPQIHEEVGYRHPAYVCIRNYHDKPAWKAYEIYLLTCILVVPTLIMGFCYGAVIREVCRVVKQRNDLTHNYGQVGANGGSRREVTGNRSGSRKEKNG